MDRISQISLNSMRLLADNQKITASNLANLNTIGFRKDVNTSIGSAYLQDPKAYEDRVFASRGDAGVDTSVSNLISTDRPLDIAINGEGFFCCQQSEWPKGFDPSRRYERDIRGQTQNGRRLYRSRRWRRDHCSAL